MPQNLDWTTIIITIVTALGSSSAYKIYQRHMDSKDTRDNLIHNDGMAFRKTLLKQLGDSQTSNERYQKEIVNLNKKVSDLTAETRMLRLRIKELLEEN